MLLEKPYQFGAGVGSINQKQMRTCAISAAQQAPRPGRQLQGEVADERFTVLEGKLEGVDIHCISVGGILLDAHSSNHHIGGFRHLEATDGSKGFFWGAKMPAVSNRAST